MNILTNIAPAADAAADADTHRHPPTSTVSAAHEPGPRSCAWDMEHHTLAETYGLRWDEKVPLVYEALLHANGAAYFETCPNFKVELGFCLANQCSTISSPHLPTTLPPCGSVAHAHPQPTSPASDLVLGRRVGRVSPSLPGGRGGGTPLHPLDRAEYTRARLVVAQGACWERVDDDAQLA